MKIEIETSLLSKLSNLTQAKYILDFDHSLSRENVGTDCCGVTRYRLVLVDEVPEIFDDQISSNIGPIYYKSWGKMYLDGNMKIRQINSGLIEFASDNNIIAQNMEIVDYRINDEKVRSY